MTELEDPFVVLADFGQGLKMFGQYETSHDAEAQLKLLESDEGFVSGTVIGAHYSAMMGE